MARRGPAKLDTIQWDAMGQKRAVSTLDCIALDCDPHLVDQSGVVSLLAHDDADLDGVFGVAQQSEGA